MVEALSTSWICSVIHLTVLIKSTMSWDKYYLRYADLHSISWNQLYDDGEMKKSGREEDWVGKIMEKMNWVSEKGIRYRGFGPHISSNKRGYSRLKFLHGKFQNAPIGIKIGILFLLFEKKNNSSTDFPLCHHFWVSIENSSMNIIQWTFNRKIE